MMKKLYTPKKDLKQVVIELAYKIKETGHRDPIRNTGFQKEIQNLIDEMNKWGTSIK